METLKLDISKTGVAVSAAMQAKAQAGQRPARIGQGRRQRLPRLGAPALVDHARPDRSHREAGREAPRKGRSDHLHRHRRLVSGSQGRARSHERFVQVPAQEADGTRRGVRRPEHLGGLHPRTARSREGVLDRHDRHLQVGNHNRTGHRLPPDQSRDRKALRQAGSRRTHRGHHRQSARRAEDARRQRGLPGRSSFPTTWADASRC